MIERGMAKARRAAAEFEDVDLGDERRNERLRDVARRAALKPDASFPKMFVTEAELEAFYRLIRNENVEPEDILKPHVEATVQRVAARSTIVVAHDTSIFRFNGPAVREGLSRNGQAGERSKQEFLAHFSLAVAEGEPRAPLGVLAMQPWARTRKSLTSLRKEKGQRYNSEARSEQPRWFSGVELSEERLAGVGRAIHVMDSEADDYGLMSQLIESQRHFVIRLCNNRLLDPKRTKGCRKVRELLKLEPAEATRDVVISRRIPSGGTPKKREVIREEREATLSIAARSHVAIRRPGSQARDLVPSITLNIVRVWEEDPPDDIVPVEWILLTTEPVETTEQILQVVDWYRARWRIEEFFKALKTGCSYEKRLLQSSQTLLNALALFVPIAWHLLHLRTQCRADASADARSLLTRTQLIVLRRAVPNMVPEEPTARDALLAIARLGGHLKRNGEPGWLVLYRGYFELQDLVRGYRLATKPDLALAEM